MGYRLEAAEPIPEGIRRIILELIDEITAQLGDAAADQDKAVHSARKNFKRIRAALRLVRDEIGETRYQAENICFRDAARRLSGARDSFVMVETVDDLADRYAAELAPDAFAPTRAQLLARYQAVRRQLLEKGDAVEKVLDTLQQARLRLRDLPVIRDDFAAFAGGLRRVYRRGRRRMALAYAVGDDPELFHDWRKRVKYLWHQSEILGPAWPSRLEQQAEALHTLSGYLGVDHDLAELNRVIRLESHRFVGDLSLPILLRLIERRRAALQAQARPLGRRLYVETPRAFVARMEGYWRIWEEEPAAPVEEERAAEETAVSAPSSFSELSYRLLTTRQTAQLCGVPILQVRRWIHQGDLAAFKLGNQWAIERAAAEAMSETESE